MTKNGPESHDHGQELSERDSQPEKTSGTIGARGSGKKTPTYRSDAGFHPSISRKVRKVLLPPNGVWREHALESGEDDLTGTETGIPREGALPSAWQDRRVLMGSASCRSGLGIFIGDCEPCTGMGRRATSGGTVPVRLRKESGRSVTTYRTVHDRAVGRGSWISSLWPM